MFAPACLSVITRLRSVTGKFPVSPKRKKDKNFYIFLCFSSVFLDEPVPVPEPAPLQLPEELRQLARQDLRRALPRGQPRGRRLRHPPAGPAGTGQWIFDQLAQLLKGCVSSESLITQPTWHFFS